MMLSRVKTILFPRFYCLHFISNDKSSEQIQKLKGHAKDIPHNKNSIFFRKQQRKMTEVASHSTGYVKNGHSEDYKGDCTIWLHTGNIANWSNLKSRKSNDIPANELYQSLTRTLEKWTTGHGGLNSGELYINCSNAEKMDENERGLLKVTAKVFLQTLKPENIREAIDSTLNQLGLRHINNIYLALPPLEEGTSFADIIVPFWEEMERLRDAGIAPQISICDLDRDKLETLVEMVRIKPEVNQVNLTSCCHMPEDLVAYAKEVGIVLHTHGDQYVMLPDESVEELIRTIQPEDTRTYTTEWVVRYAIVVKCRGVIKNKGYITSIKAKNEKKNGAEAVKNGHSN